MKSISLKIWTLALLCFVPISATAEEPRFTPTGEFFDSLRSSFFQDKSATENGKAANELLASGCQSDPAQRAAFLAGTTQGMSGNRFINIGGINMSGTPPPNSLACREYANSFTPENEYLGINVAQTHKMLQYFDANRKNDSTRIKDVTLAAELNQITYPSKLSSAESAAQLVCCMRGYHAGFKQLAKTVKNALNDGRNPNLAACQSAFDKGALVKSFADKGGYVCENNPFPFKPEIAAQMRAKRESQGIYPPPPPSPSDPYGCYLAGLYFYTTPDENGEIPKAPDSPQMLVGITANAAVSAQKAKPLEQYIAGPVVTDLLNKAATAGAAK